MVNLTKLAKRVAKTGIELLKEDDECREVIGSVNNLAKKAKKTFYEGK